MVSARCLSAMLVGTLMVVSNARQVNISSDLDFLSGDWVFVEDRTEGRSLEELSPPMGAMFTFRVVDGAVFLVFGHGGQRDVRVAIDGTVTEIPSSVEGEVARYTGNWKDSALSYQVEYAPKAGGATRSLIRREFRISQDGLIVRSNLGSGSEYGPVGYYRHPQDIPMPTPAKAVISDLPWLVGSWTGTRGTAGTTTIEERWSPPLGGSMLAVSRTVFRGKLSAFEYLRIVERDGGLVYIAQPNGGPATDFVMTEMGPKRAVFENPRHDYPKRIVYELTEADGLTATIGFSKGGTPRRFEYRRETPPK